MHFERWSNDIFLKSKLPESDFYWSFFEVFFSFSKAPHLSKLAKAPVPSQMSSKAPASPRQAPWEYDSNLNSISYSTHLNTNTRYLVPKSFLINWSIGFQFGQVNPSSIMVDTPGRAVNGWGETNRCVESWCASTHLVSAGPMIQTMHKKVQL